MQIPENLSEESRKLFDALKNDAKSPGRAELLKTALLARDRAIQAQTLINQQGILLVTKKSGMTHLNPLLKTERENRQLFLKIMTALNLQWNQSIDGKL